MTHAHTPGPWHTGENGDACAKGHAICAGPYVIAKVYGGGYPVGAGWSPRTQADANLIVLAPDLLELAQAIATGKSSRALLAIWAQRLVRKAAKPQRPPTLTKGKKR